MTTASSLRIGVIGAGVMGSGIAQVIAQSGFEVKCTDVAEEALDKARANVTTGRYGWERAVERGKLDQATAEAAMERLQFTTNLEEAVGDGGRFAGRAALRGGGLFPNG